MISDNVSKYQDIYIKDKSDISNRERSRDIKKKLNLQEASEIQEPKDKLSISKEAMDKLRADQEAIRQQLEALEDADRGKEEGMILAKLLEIARRISRGDIVPIEDEKKLMEFNSKLYQIAKAAAVLNANDKKKKHKSLFEEESNEETKEKIRALENEIQEITNEISVSEEAPSL